jgi:GNAT superfamily N-acetyltransferase
MLAYRYDERSCVQIIQTEPNKALVEEFFVDPEKRGRGVGTRLMKKTCRDADRENVTLYLKPMPYGEYDPEVEEYHPPTLTFKQLCAFYRTFGFRFLPKNSEVMMRKPK